MTCYFDLLAPELISLIFIYATEKRDGHFVEYSVDKPPLAFLRVCKRWRYIAFQTREIFDSISLRRRTRAPYGFDFGLDSWVLHAFLHFPRTWYRRSGALRPLSMQICYGDIKKYGDKTMWCDLIRMVRIIIETTENLERFYLRVPDDCMEKFLMKLGSKTNKPISHPTLRSLTLHSTREGYLQRRYYSWWFDQESNYMPAYYHKLDVSQLPALEELGLHFPGPITLDPVCKTVRKLHVSLFKWEQMEEYFGSCPKVEHLILELREALLEQDWEPEILLPTHKFPHIRTLEVRSALKGWACANKLFRLFMGVKMPNLRALRLRRLPQTDKDDCPHFRYGSMIMSEAHKLEELELIDFPPEACSNWNIGGVFARALNLKRLAYREEEIVSHPDYFTHLIKELSFSVGKELRAPKLEVLELDSIHLRNREPQVMQLLTQLIASRRYPTFFVNTTRSFCLQKEQQAVPVPIQKVLLPFGCSDVIRQLDVRGMCIGVEFDCLPALQKLEREDDLDEEGPPRKNGSDWVPLRWPNAHEADISFQSQSSGSFQPRTFSTQSSRSSGSMQSGSCDSPVPSTPSSTESITDIEQTCNPSTRGRDVNEMSSSPSQGSLGLTQMGSLAEVEMML